jgi:thiazole synthase
MALNIGGAELQSRFFLGTAGYPSPQVLQEAIGASGAQVVTVGLKRQLAAGGVPGDFYAMIRATGARLLPNTAGCRTAREAITLSQMARELFDTNWIKLEVVGDDYTLQPDPFELVEAARTLARTASKSFPTAPTTSSPASACSTPAAAS